MKSSAGLVTPHATCQLAAWLTAVGIPNSLEQDRVTAITRDKKKVLIGFAEAPEQPVVARLRSGSNDKHEVITLYRRQAQEQGLDLIDYMRKYAKDNDMKVLDFTLDGDRSIMAKFMVPPSRVTLDVNRFTAHTDSGFNINDAQEVFAELQKVLGYEPKRPVDRGVEADNVRHNGSFGEDTIFRHKEFRRSPNPTAADFERYDSVIKTAIRIFMLRWPRLLQGFGVEQEDLRQYCLIWVTNFVGLYERADLTPQDNSSLCYKYLVQRFLELKNWMAKRAKNSLMVNPGCYSHPGGFVQQQITLKEDGGRTFDGGDMNAEIMDAVMNPERYISFPLQIVETPVDEQYRARNALYSDYTDNGERKRAAKEVLGQLLAGLTHEEYVERLSATAMNACCDTEARLEAVRQFLKHAKTCGACSDYAELLAVKVHEDVTRLDPFSS